MKISIDKLIYTLGVLSALVLAYVFIYLSPRDIHAAGLMGVFVMLYLVSFALVYMIWEALCAVGSRSGMVSLTKTRSGFKYYVVSVLGFVPVLMLGMQSLGQLGWVDVGLVVIFVAVAILYGWRRLVSIN